MPMLNVIIYQLRTMKNAPCISDWYYLIMQKYQILTIHIRQHEPPLIYNYASVMLINNKTPNQYKHYTKNTQTTGHTTSKIQQ